MFTTYASKPIYITNKKRAFFYSNYEVFIFDFSKNFTNIVELWNLKMSGK